MAIKGSVCVTGAAGFIGSWLVMKLIQQGYNVRATVRDPNNLKKLKHLLNLPNAETQLSLWKAELEDEGSFDEAIKGCVGVFHVATPMILESDDPKNDVIKPTIDGTLNVLKSCVKAETVRRVIYTSTIGAVGIEPVRKKVYDDNSWTDVGFCREEKMIGWMYFVGKTLAEKAAWEFCDKNNLDMISIIPSFVNGPFITPNVPPSMIPTLALIIRSPLHYPMLNSTHFVHVDDVCTVQIFLFEHPKAKGRYICSSHDVTISQLANMLRERYPEYDIPTEFEGIDEVSDINKIRFSSKKLTDLGFEFKYTLEDMFDGAIKLCKEKGFIPLSTKKGHYHIQT